MTARLDLALIGLVIAEVIPLAIAIGRNAALMPSRFGRPKLTFDAPQVVLTPSSSRSRRTIRKTWRPAVAIAPMGMTSGSTTMSARGMPWSAARSTICLATANRTSGSSVMPGVVVADRDDRRAVLPDQRQDPLQPLLLAGHAS